MTEQVESPVEREALEREIRERCERGDIGGAVERTLQAYGRELLRLMHSVLHEPERARDAFSLFSENLLKGLPGFRWESSLRTWTYRLARNACYQVLHAPARREQPMSLSALPDEADHHRTDTHPWQRTSVKERFRELRQRLKPEERMLLMLRVDQRLSWMEIARVMTDTGEEGRPVELTRKAAALRQQFQRLKARLRELAEEEGLISREESGASG
ncbi:sigma-70 family RNA polymerase sigma factor [Myxococcaceae bacterium GXIMD 01537]